MGTYDEVHIDGTEWQTKGLGRNSLQYRIGDAVEVQMTPRTDEEHRVARTYRYDELPERYLVQAQAIAYIVVENGRIAGLATEEDQASLFYDRFDYRGYDEADVLRHLFDIPRPSRTVRPGEPPIADRPGESR